MAVGLFTLAAFETQLGFIHNSAMRGCFLVDGSLKPHFKPSSYYLGNLHGDCSNVPPAASGACTLVFSIELFLN